VRTLRAAAAATSRPRRGPHGSDAPVGGGPRRAATCCVRGTAGVGARCQRPRGDWQLVVGARGSVELGA